MDQTDRRRRRAFAAFAISAAAALTNTGRRHGDKMLSALIKLAHSSTALHALLWAVLQSVASLLGVHIPWTFAGIAAGGYALKESAAYIAWSRVKHSLGEAPGLSGATVTNPVAVAPVSSSDVPDELFATRVRAVLSRVGFNPHTGEQNAARNDDR